ncbi:hypothetical protein GCM10009332_23920 [Shewanella gelidii]|uniref:Uncharacterized protein n=1 Tax=Shewanella gelidii TaxID=1642821 RepID=A0A917JVL1_9GAMM|nr:hypothetical protein GCM10009332_23920 [Shewanella gelidii]
MAIKNVEVALVVIPFLKITTKDDVATAREIITSARWPKTSNPIIYKYPYIEMAPYS